MSCPNFDGGHVIPLYHEESATWFIDFKLISSWSGLELLGFGQRSNSHDPEKFW